jgi:hypothetical protein
MLAPLVLPGIEQARLFACFRVNAAQVWSLVEIAAMTGKRKILGRILPAVLSGNNVFDVERRQRLEIVMKPTVFASSASPLLHQPAQSRVHQVALRLASQIRALAWRTEIKSSACT